MIKLIDLSHYSTVTSWQQIKDNANVGVYLKCTEGRTLVDRKFQGFAQESQAIGLRQGAYHLFHGGDDPIVQAQFFLSEAGQGMGDMPPMLDLERGDAPATVSDVEAILQWLQYMETQTMRTPFLYGSTSLLSDLKLDVRFARYGLWVAEYGVKEPRIPQPWTAWTIWQYAENGVVPGVEGDCDVDVYNGTKIPLP